MELSKYPALDQVKVLTVMLMCADQLTAAYDPNWSAHLRILIRVGTEVKLMPNVRPIGHSIALTVHYEMGISLQSDLNQIWDDEYQR